MGVINTQVHQEEVEVSSPTEELLCGTVTRQLLVDGILDEFPVRIVDQLLGIPAYGLEFLEAFLSHAFIEPEPVLSTTDSRERFAYCCVQNIRELAQELQWGYDTVHKYVVIFCALGLLQKSRYQQKVYLQLPLQGYTFPATLDELDKLIAKSRSRVQQLAERIKTRCYEYQLVKLPSDETKKETLALPQTDKLVIRQEIPENHYDPRPEKDLRHEGLRPYTCFADPHTQPYAQEAKYLCDEVGTEEFEEALSFLKETYSYTEQCFAEKRRSTLAGPDDLQAAFITQLLINDPYYYQKYAAVLRSDELVQVETFNAEGEPQHICDIYPHYFEIGFPINRYAWEYLGYQPDFQFFMFDDNMQPFHLPCYAISSQYSPFDFYTDSSPENTAHEVQEASNAPSTTEIQDSVPPQPQPEVLTPFMIARQKFKVTSTKSVRTQTSQPLMQAKQEPETSLPPPTTYLPEETRARLSQLDRYSFLSAPKNTEGKVMVIGNSYDSPYSKKQTGPKYIYPHELKPGDVTKESQVAPQQVSTETAQQQPEKVLNHSFSQADEQTGKPEITQQAEEMVGRGETKTTATPIQQSVPQEVKAQAAKAKILPLSSSGQKKITPPSSEVQQQKHPVLPVQAQPVDNSIKKPQINAKQEADGQFLTRQNQTANREERSQEATIATTTISKIPLSKHLIPLEYWETETLARLHDKIDYVPDYKLDFTYNNLRDLQKVYSDFPTPETFLEVDAYRDWRIADFPEDFLASLETLNVITLIKYIINNNNILLRNTLITFFVSVFDKKTDDKTEKSRYYQQLFKKGFHPDVICSAFLSTLFTVYGKKYETIERPGALFIHICQKLQEKVNQLGHLTYLELNLLKKYGKLTCVDLAIALHDNLVEQEATNRLSVYLSVITTTGSCYRAQLAAEAEEAEVINADPLEEEDEYAPLKNKSSSRDGQRRKYYHYGEQQWKRAQ